MIRREYACCAYVPMICIEYATSCVHAMEHREERKKQRAQTTIYYFAMLQLHRSARVVRISLQCVQFHAVKLEALEPYDRLLHMIYAEDATKVIQDDPREFAFIIKEAGKQYKHLSRPDSEKMLETISSVLKTVDLRPDDIGNILYGSRNLVPSIKRSKFFYAMVYMLSDKVRACKGKFTNVSIAKAFHGIQNMNSGHREARALIGAYADAIDQLNFKLSCRTVASIMYGMKDMYAYNSPQVSRLLVALTGVLTDSREEFQAREVACLYGLRNFTIEDPYVQPLLAALAKKVISCREVSPRAFTTALYGLQRFTSDTPVVRELIFALYTAYDHKNVTMSSIDILNGMYGIKRMTDEYSEVRSILQVMAKGLQSYTGTFSAKEISGIYYSMKEMKWRSEEVATIHKLLNDHLETTPELSLTGEHISNIIFGLKSIGDNEQSRRTLKLVLPFLQRLDTMEVKFIGACFMGIERIPLAVEEVRAIIRALIPIIRRIETTMRSHSVGSIFRGLRNMTSEDPLSQELMEAIAEVLENSEGQLKCLCIAQAVQGLQHMSINIPCVRRSLEILMPMIITSRDTFLPISLTTAIHSLRYKDPSDPLIKVLLKHFTTKLRSLKDPVSPSDINLLVETIVLLDSRNPDVTTLMNATEKMVRKAVEIDVPFISKALMQLKNRSDQNRTRIRFIEALEGKMRHTLGK